MIQIILNGSTNIDPVEILKAHYDVSLRHFQSASICSGTVGVCDPFTFLVISNSGNETPSGGVGCIPRKGIAGIGNGLRYISMQRNHGWLTHLETSWNNNFKCPTQDCSHLFRACSCFGGDLQGDIFLHLLWEKQNIAKLIWNPQPAPSGNRMLTVALS